MDRPVSWHDDLDCWIVADPALGRRVLQDAERFSSATFERCYELYMSREARAEFGQLTRFLQLWFVQADGAEHAELRRPLQRRLSPGYFRSLMPSIERITGEALDDLERHPPHDAVRWVSDVVPARVMTHVVGLPDDRQISWMYGWSRALSSFIAAMYRGDYARAAQDALRKIEDRLTPVVDASLPKEASVAERERAFATTAMLLFGGLETTASLLSGVLLHALRDPHIWSGVRADRPGAVEAVVEHVLRTRPPLRNLGRVAAMDQELAGVQLRQGDLILIPLAHDELLTVADDTGAAANETTLSDDESHLAFGYGAHYCIGAPLARLEASVLLRQTARRFPRARLSDETVTWRPNLSYVSPAHVHLDLQPSQVPLS